MLFLGAPAHRHTEHLPIQIPDYLTLGDCIAMNPMIARKLCVQVNTTHLYELCVQVTVTQHTCNLLVCSHERHLIQTN